MSDSDNQNSTRHKYLVAIVIGVIVIFSAKAAIPIAWSIYELFISPILAQSDTLFPSYSYNYRLTVEIEVDGRVVTASGVTKVINKTLPKEFGSFATNVIGEAVYVDLGDRKPLILEGGVGLNSVFSDWPFKNEEDTVIRLSQLKNVKKSLSTRIPWRAVTFDDPKDPDTLQEVDLGDLTKILGNGIKILSITVETTDDPVTHEIENKLPWIRKFNDDGRNVQIKNTDNKIYSLYDFKKDR